MLTPQNRIITKRKNAKTSDEIQDDADETSDDEDESEPMDFERAFGSTSEIPKLDFMNNDQKHRMNDRLNTFEGELYFDFASKVDLNTYKQPVLVSSTINLNALAAVSFFFDIFQESFITSTIFIFQLFNLNDKDLSDSQNVFEYLGYELAVRCVNDLCNARAFYIQCCSLPISSYERSIQRFYQGIEQACQQLNCTFLKTTSISPSFNALCTGVCNKDLCLLNNENPNPIINEGDFLVALRCSSSTINSQGYVQLKELFQKKNIHLNDSVPFRNDDGEEESFFSLLLQKTSILTPAIIAVISELISNRTIKFIRYLKGIFFAIFIKKNYDIFILDVGLSRMIQSLTDASAGSLVAELNGQKWPIMPPIFTWIYQNVNITMR